eukprot:scaffold393781_cov20-Prasinocladus_malaysianus.AAC.1
MQENSKGMARVALLSGLQLCCFPPAFEVRTNIRTRGGTIIPNTALKRVRYGTYTRADRSSTNWAVRVP